MTGFHTLGASTSFTMLRIRSSLASRVAPPRYCASAAWLARCSAYEALKELEPTIAGTPADALGVGMNPMFFPHLDRMAGATLRRGLPTIVSGGLARDAAVAGILCSYDVDFEEVVRRAAGCTNRILRGAKPADIPIEQPIRY